MSDKIEPQVPLAIIGVGCLFPKAQSLREFWSNIKAKVDGITEIPPSHWSTQDYFEADPKKPDMTYARRGGFLSPVEFDPSEFGITPATLEATDSAQLLGLVAAQMALKDAGYGPEREFDKNKVSVILGVTGTLELVVPLGARLGHPVWRKALKDHGIEGAEAESIIDSIKDGYVPWQESSFPGLLGNVVAGRIANRFNLGGTNCVVDAACASSLSATHLASLELATRRSSMVVTGGVDCFNDIFMYMCFSKTPALSPTGDAKPFDKKADGTILGEGLGMVVLKRLDDAERDGDKIYAVIKGVGSSSDGRGKSIYAPSAEGQAKALKKAYEVSGVSPDTVELVEAHGTGTSVGDAAEVTALKEVYGATGRQGRWAGLGSVKSMIGHTKAAAGSAGMIKAALSLYHKVLPPTIKVSEPTPALENSPFYLNTEKRPWAASGKHPRRAAISALGFGGSNFHVVLEEHRPQKVEIDWDGRVQLLAFSGADVKASLSSFAAPSDWSDLCVAAAKTRAAFDASHARRLLIVVEKDADLSKLLASALGALSTNQGKTSWSLPDGVFFGSGARQKVAALFAGQGSQYVGMGRDLFCQFPQAESTLETANAAFDSKNGARLSDLMDPPPALNEAEKAEQETALRSTDVAQPALGAAGLAMHRVLEYFGFAADAYAGHSYGELAALCAAGRVDETALHMLSGLRGRLMAEGDGGRGGMFAAQCAASEAQAILDAEKLELVVANKNAPKQSVLSGRKEEVARAAEIFEKRGIRGVTLPVSAAFHSPLVSGAAKPFGETLSQVSFEKGTAPVYANKTADAYPAGAPSCRALLSSQLASPVEWVSLVEKIHASGVSAFIELGPGARLTGLVGQILSGREFSSFAVDASGGKRNGVADLARALAQLAASGQPLKLDLWEGGEQAALAQVRKKGKMSVKLTGANYRSTPAKVTNPVKIARQAPASPQSFASQAFAAPAALPAAPVSAAIQAAQDSLNALQRLQEQTATLHLKFLESQEAAQRQFQALVEQQQRLFGAVLSGTPMPAMPAMPQTLAPAQSQLTPASVETRFGIRPGADARPQPALAGKSSRANVSEVLLAVVAEKTGYPVETLNPTMDLESDLGIDSIKRVEILSSIQEKLPGAPKVKPEHLGKLRTLQSIVDFLNAGMPAAAPASSTGSSRNESVDNSKISSTLMAVVSEKTGYPLETLNPTMDLESDLGIDSIKRVEILSSIQEKLPGAPKVKPEHLGKLRTLQSIVDFLNAGMPSAAPASSTGSSRNESVDNSKIASTVMAVVSEKTGYPLETLNPTMDLESDLGIDSIKRVEILSALQEKLPGAPKVKPEHLGKLRTLQSIVDFLSCAAAPASPSAPAVAAAAVPEPGAVPTRKLVKTQPFARPRQALKLAKAPVLVAGDAAFAAALVQKLAKSGVDARAIALDAPIPERLAGLIIAAAPKKLDKDALWDAASESFLLDALMLAKRCGPALRAGAARGGAMFATVSRLDGKFGFSGLRAGQDPVAGGLAGLAKTAAREWPEVSCRALDAADWSDAASAVADESMVEGPVELGLSSTGAQVVSLEEVPAPEDAGFPLEDGDVVLVTGGARGVTVEAAAALAKKAKLSFVLLGRSPLPGAEDAALASCKTEAELKKALAGLNPGLPPKKLGELCKKIVAAREIASNLGRLEAAGARVAYVQADLRDLAAVKKAVAALGPVKGLVHGAGVLADKLIVDKTAEQAREVVETKLTGLRHVLSALDVSALKAVCLFSSSTARFGRAGQSDYAMANEALNKIAQLLAQRLGSCRVVSIDWGPWDGGMVDGSLRKLFISEGVGVIGKEDGGKFLVDELSGPCRSSEIVCVAELVRGQAAKGELELVLEREISVDEVPVLRSHVINGKAVVPVALMVEWLAHAAMHGNPGLNFTGLEKLRVLKGVLLEDGRARKVSLLAGKAVRGPEGFRVPVALRGEGGVTHASAEVLLSAKRPAAPAPAGPAALEAYGRSIERAYAEVLFHGPELRGIRRVLGLSHDGIVCESAAALPPAQWARRPLRDAWLADPLALDAAFQAMILWTAERAGGASLPTFIKEYRQYAAGFPETGVEIRARVMKSVEGQAVADIDFVDDKGALVARFEGYECAVDASLAESFRRNELVSR